MRAKDLDPVLALHEGALEALAARKREPALHSRLSPQGSTSRPSFFRVNAWRMAIRSRAMTTLWVVTVAFVTMFDIEKIAKPFFCREILSDIFSTMAVESSLLLRFLAC